MVFFPSIYGIATTRDVVKDYGEGVQVRTACSALLEADVSYIGLLSRYVYIQARTITQFCPCCLPFRYSEGARREIINIRYCYCISAMSNTRLYLSVVNEQLYTNLHT